MLWKTEPVSSGYLSYMNHKYKPLNLPVKTRKKFSLLKVYFRVLKRYSIDRIVKKIFSPIQAALMPTDKISNALFFSKLYIFSWASMALGNYRTYLLDILTIALQQYYLIS